MRTLLLFLLLALPFGASAAELTVLRPSAPIHAGDTFSAVVSLNTGTDTVNAVEGSMHIPAGLKLSSVRLSGSVVPLWLSPPAPAGDSVSFAGVLPGGFQGSGVLFTLVLEAEKTGPVSLSFGQDSKAYSNDGAGTEIPLQKLPLRFSVEKSAGAPTANTISSDTTSPEPFVPLRASGEPFGEKGMVLVFQTQDKDSGVQKYEVASSYDKHASEGSLVWKESASPYILAADDASQFLFVRATDYAGNTRVARISPASFSSFALLASWWMPILGLLLLVILIGIFVRRRRALGKVS